jgi:glycosyltransferase involved in cell wall biosynthesis
MTTEPNLSSATVDSEATAETLVVVPTYNESANIAELIHQFFAVAGDLHLLVVDDHSPDGTGEIVQKLKTQYPNLELLRREGERGLGLAVTAGIRHGLEQDFQTIGTMDADLSHSPAYLPKMLCLLEGCDLVIGSRYIRDGGTVNWGIHRILLSWLANEFAAALLRVPAHDITSGYRLYRRKTLEWIQTGQVKSTGYSFEGELLYRAHQAGARIVECPIIFHDRTLGVSKLHRSEIYRGAIHLLRLRFSKR